MYDDKLLARFWCKVRRTTPSDCWHWMAGKKGCGGYGGFYAAGVDTYAHRVAWQIANGHIPAGLLILHKCDNPSCVNPDHLYAGTQKDNVRDKLERYRSREEMRIARIYRDYYRNW